ncbi:MAG: TonB-dependent receptor [Candidatus Omnitrophica bacterium]|nr:TonB-dependent receptor [Candidatus Omnitrophota bacterium]
MGWGAGEARAEETRRFDEVVVSATKAKTPAKRVTRSISVVEGEGLGEREGSLVAEGLRTVPGTLVRRSGPIGRTTSVVVRGASAPQVHVTIDGAHAASPTTGFFDFNHFAPDNLERVEVLRGPHSVLYGSDAMGGVINLETRRGEGPLTGSYTQEVGSWDTWREAGEFQGSAGPWHLSGSASRLDSQGVSENEEYENTTFSTRVGYDFGSEHTLDVSVRNILSIVGIDDSAFRPDPNRKNRERQTLGSVKWQAPVTPWWNQSVRFSTNVANLIDQDPSDRAGNANSLSKFDSERYTAEWSNRLTPVEWDTLTAGFEFEDREADNRRFSKAQQMRAGYLQNQWNPTDALTVLGGARWFRESAFGADYVLDGSAAYFFAPWDLKLRGGYGQGFRAPTLNELFFPNFGNPDLQAEDSETMEAGAEQVLFEDLLEWSATVFRTNYTNLIQITRINAATSAPLNVGKARVDGVELEAKVSPWKPWSLEGTFTHLQANERARGEEELLRVPKNSLGLAVAFAPERWGIRLDGLLLSSREESTATNVRNKTEGYFKWDLYAHYQVKEWLRGFVRLENVTKQHYQEILGFPSPGFTATLGFTLET